MSRSFSFPPIDVLLSNFVSLYIRPGAIDIQFVDFDGVRFHLHTPEKKSGILLSMSIRCWDELVKYGALDIIHREYGPYVAPSVEAGYNVSLTFDVSSLPQGGMCTGLKIGQ